jgi:hypothetical protein
MSTINDGGPAFPRHALKITFPDGSVVPHDPGMTLRQYYAGQALAGLLAKYGLGEADPESMAADAYAYADAMLRAGEVKP